MFPKLEEKVDYLLARELDAEQPLELRHDYNAGRGRRESRYRRRRYKVDYESQPKHAHEQFDPSGQEAEQEDVVDGQISGVGES